MSRTRARPRIKLLDVPPVNSLADLINISKTLKFYKNIDILMLWRIAPHLEELDKMIGMDTLKETILNQIIYYLQGMHKNKNEEYLHTVIYGAPGCGKTSIARIIGKLYQDMNILSSSSPFRIAYREDFISGYLGQTATKTKKLLQSCIGGVLFIDEVYSLAPRNNDKDSFSKEAIDTLTGFLSEHKNDFCCIIAGYEDEISNCFFAMNKGLERRFPWIHRIPQYTTSQLSDIFIKMVKDIGWQIDFDKIFLESVLDKNKVLFTNSGGDIETFITKCKIFHSKRVFSLPSENKFILTKEDINTAIKYITGNRPVTTAPEHMYT
jgi:SpoVK/Ycf46/Vps4 family AAA+-type ATPase